jgi:hypothetical protein
MPRPIYARKHEKCVAEHPSWSRAYDHCRGCDLPWPCPSVVKEKRTTVVDTPIPGIGADAAEQERLAENIRFRIWEAGYLAGLQASQGGHPRNPYSFHGKRTP